MSIYSKKYRALAKVNYELFEQTGEVTSVNVSCTVLPSPPQLHIMFEKINAAYFGGRLPLTRIAYSNRMLIAGSYTPSMRLIKIGRKYHEIFPEEIEDTLKHEMIHILYPNHDRNFKLWAKKIGASLKARAHPLLRCNPKYLYVCPACGREYPRRKRLRMASCGVCTKGRHFDPRYKLKLALSKNH